MSEAKLIDWLASVSDDPLSFVMGAFPWGVPGTRLENCGGPEPWQREVLELIRQGLPIPKAIRIACASGRGIGKTTLEAWISWWALSTMADTKGKITANTEAQLRTITWSAIAQWHHLFIAKDLFTVTATAAFAKGREKTWRLDMATWSENNTEAFQGMHNYGRRMFIIFDEASGIPDKIWEVTEGSLTDQNSQMIWCAFSNPTKNTGYFRDCFPGRKHAQAWTTMQIDSREVSLTDKALFKQWIDAHGDDSDFVRVHVKGEFPRTGYMEFISSEDVANAQTADVIGVQKTDPLVIGVDVARFGANESVIYFRKGRDGRSIQPLRLRGLSTVELASKVAEVHARYRVDAIFVDGGGVGGGVVDNLRALRVPCFDVNFGSKPDGVGWSGGVEGERYANKRAEMWGLMRGWLKGGCIPALPELREQLTGPTYKFNLKNEIVLEAKEDMMKRGLESPDIADALALTFAYPVAANINAGGDYPHRPSVEWEYNPYDERRMAAEAMAMTMPTEQGYYGYPQ